MAAYTVTTMLYCGGRWPYARGRFCVSTTDRQYTLLVTLCSHIHAISQPAKRYLRVMALHAACLVDTKFPQQVAKELISTYLHAPRRWGYVLCPS